MNTATAHLADSQHPWIGLASFTESDREFFAGRGEEIDELLRLVRRDALTLLYGVSGLGKTSLLQAGLFPALRAEDYLPVPIRLDYLEGATPLASQVLGAITAAADSVRVEAPQPRPDETLWEYFHREGNHFWSPRNDLITPFLAFDQFEELFTLGRETPESATRATAFISELADLVENCPPAALRDDPLRAKEFSFRPAPLKVLLAMREDYLADIDRIRSHFRALGQNRQRLLPMGERQARQVIALGARLLAPGVEDRIRKFVAGGDGDAYAAEITIAPALLSLVLRELNERRLARGPDAKITADLLDVEQQRIFEDFYLRTIQNFPVGVRTFIEDKLLTTTGYRDSCALDDALSCPDVTQPILNELVNQRLLAYEDRHHTRRVELTHDVLIPVIKASRDTRLAREALAQVERQQREADEKVRVARRRFAFVTVLFGLAVVAAIYGFWQKGKAEKLTKEARKAENSARAAEQRTKEVASQVNLSHARYLRAAGDDAQALAHLAQALRLNQKNDEAAALASTMLTQTCWPILVADPLRHSAALHSAEFSPDGRRAVTASDDDTARLWDTATGRPIGEPMKHEKGVVSAQFSPDGQRVVTASYDKTARLWDAATGRPIGEPMKHDGWVNSAQFSPDGGRVVTASNDNTARLWDSTTGRPIGEPMKHVGPVNSAQFSPNSQRVVTASKDRTARLWDATTGKPIGEPMKHEDDVVSVQFSPNGEWIVTASYDNTARVWDSATGKSVGGPMKHEKEVYTAQFSPDGQRVVTASYDNTARLWDAATGKPIGEPMKHEGPIYSARFSPGGERVVTASEDNTARLWDAATGRQIGEPMKHEEEVGSAQFGPYARRVLTASLDGTARLWDAAIGTPIGEPMRHEGSVNFAQFSPDGLRLVTASRDGTAQLWDTVTGHEIGERMKHEKEVYQAQFSPGGRRVVTASKDNTARLWDATTGKPIGEPMKHDSSVYSAQFSPDGRRVVTASYDNTARLWDAVTGRPIGEPMKHEGWVNSAQFSPDGGRVVTASNDNTARLWDAVTGRPIGEPMKHGGPVNSAQFSPNSKQVVTASKDSTARLWDAATGEPIGGPMQHEKEVYSAQFSPDGQCVATASRDRTARLWDAATGKPIGEPMQHENEVYFAQFSPHGRRVVTASKDRTARLWDAATGKPIGEPMEHAGWVNSAQFSPDGQQVLTASEDDTARLWDVPAISSPASAEDVLLLADLAEATAGVVLQRSGQAEILNVLTPEQVKATRQKIAGRFPESASGLTPLQRCLQWSVSDPRRRSLSPFSKRTVSAWVEERINDGILDGLRAAIIVDPANMRLAAHFGRRLADYALEKGIDPAEARRARAEADFQTRRALRLAPENDEVNVLRADVVKLLQLPSK